MTTEIPAVRTSLLRHGAYWRWSAATQFGRLPTTMAPLALTMLTSATTGSYRAGAMMMVAFVVGELIAAIPAGRLLDRIGPTRGTRLLLVASACSMLAVPLAVTAGLPLPGLLTLTGVCGAVAGGISAGFRSLLASTVSDDMLVRAISVDAVLMEAVIIAGPVLTVALATGGSEWPLLGMAAAFAISALVLPRVRTTAVSAEADPVTGPNRISWLPAAGWLACMFTVGNLLSALEVGTIALAERVGAQQSAAALLITVLSVASIVGSAMFGWRGKATTGIALMCLVGYAAGGGLIAAGFGWAGLLSGLAVVGLCTGPLLSVSSISLQYVLPPARRSEGFSVAYVVQSVGFATGSFSLSVLDLGLAIALGAGTALVAAVVVVAVRGTSHHADATTAEL